MAKQIEGVLYSRVLISEVLGKKYSNEGTFGGNSAGNDDQLI